MATALFANLWPSTVAFAAELDGTQTENLAESDSATEETTDEVEEVDSEEETTSEAVTSEEVIIFDDVISEDEVTLVDEDKLDETGYDVTSANGAQEEQGFIVTFGSFEGGKVVAYDRQNLDEAVAYEDADHAVARDSDTGEVDTTGSGQVNFSVVIEDGYKLESVSVTEGEGNYKNFKTISEEGNT